MNIFVLKTMIKARLSMMDKMVHLMVKHVITTAMKRLEKRDITISGCMPVEGKRDL
jgi:hypothetical protein